MIPFFVVDVAFLAANVPKIPTGGWFPLLVGVALVAQMTTWRRGRELVARRIRHGETSIRSFAMAAVDEGVPRVPGTAVYLFKDAGVAPPALVANLKHNKVLHQMTILVSVEVEDIPRVAIRKRARYTHLAEGVIQVRLHFGFMDDPDVPAALSSLKMPHYEFDATTASYFIGRESVTSGKVPGMNPLREQLFVLLNRGAANASRFFHLPPDQVFEVGTQVVI